MRNLLRSEEIYILANAIEAMVFQLKDEAGQIIVKDGKKVWKRGEIQLCFEGRIVFKIDYDTMAVKMAPLSGEMLQVWKPRMFSLDWLLKKALRIAIQHFSEVMWKVKLQDYRALFGRQMTMVIEDLAIIMEKAETEARELSRLDKTHAAQEFHPEIERMLQLDPNDYDGPTAPPPADDDYQVEGD